MVYTTFYYILLFVLTSILAEVSAKLKENTLLDKIFKVLFIVLVLSIPAYSASIRYQVGTDFFSYVNIFNNLKIGIIPTRIEPGYLLLNQLVNWAGGNIQHVFFTASYIGLLFVYLFLTRFKNQVSLGLGFFIYFLMFYNNSLNTVRQGIAIPVVLYSFQYIKEKQVVNFLILILFASLFHRSALVALPFYYLYNILGNKSFVFRLLIYGVAFGSLFYYREIVTFISVYILNDSYYLNYAQFDSIDIGIGILISYIPTIIVGILFTKKFTEDDPNFKFYFFLLTVGFIFKLFPYFGINYLNRISDYFIATSIWLIPYFYRILTKNRDTLFIAMLFILFNILIWFVSYMINNSAETVPYITIFN